MVEFEELNLGPVTASLVVTASGSAIGEHGNSRGIGNETDLALLKWLRRRSQVVLTSGLTARLEDYRMPAHADLALLSRAKHARPAGGTERQFLELGELASYSSALAALASRGYERIQTEFGPTGFSELVKAGSAIGVISSVDPKGIEAFALIRKFSVDQLISVQGLWIAVTEGVARPNRG